ncbi:MAG: SsrA-binding protein SmpB [Gammaproteobacteria bacterium]|uniref:SsrA-binding protein SmpB n=1 Tax=Pseudomaricurvus alcaniphilus TaxID=1166482 RepID=UPI00140C2705|nr:SsrA-binding protein SmpB [Pseudomaricurvus alcaniphilus]MBR9909685.1 SsrA-binding protein SmpB [Gammaproteobacteria bacterium]NHN36891.1 SsrA-binding protein SmpB [Pseudomaricurvus alcaniphilus]
MSKQKSKKSSSGGTIAQNKKARFDYHLTDKFEAGIALNGWEVKSLREGKVQIVDSYVFFKNGEAWLLNAQITPLSTVSTHFVVEPTRQRKLLLHSKEIAKLQQAVEQKDYTCVCTALYWKGHLVKCEIALAKGKKMHDKRETEKQRDWNREKQRLFQKPA